MTTIRTLVLTTTSAIASAPAFAQDHPQAGGESRSAFEQALGIPHSVRVSGSVRPRYETMANTFVAGETGGDDLLSVRSLLGVEVDAGPLTFTGELLDARWLKGDRGGRAANQTDALEPAQLLVSWTWKDAFTPGAALKTDLGRFTMDIGSRRLVARSSYSNLLPGFDGLRATWASSYRKADALRITAFAVSPTRREPSDISSLRDNEVALNATATGVRALGVHFDAPLLYSVRGEAYAFDLDERDKANAPSRNRDLLTVGGRLVRARDTGELDFDVELAHQTGTARETSNQLDTADLDHEATMLHVEGGFSFVAPMSPRVSVVYDFASGDESPLDGRSGRFDPLFGDRSFEFGPTSIWGLIARSNLSSPGVRLEFEPDAASDVLLMLRHIELAEARDVFASSGVEDPTGASGRSAGQQVEMRYRRWLVEDSVRLALGGTILFTGDFLEQAPNATQGGDAAYGYSEISWMF